MVLLKECLELDIQNQKNSQKSYKIAFVYCVDVLGMVSTYSNESQPQNPEFTNKPKNFHPCTLFKEIFCYPCFLFSYMYKKVTDI